MSKISPTASPFHGPLLDQIENLRRQASGRFLNASRPGVYQFQEFAPAQRAGRAFRALEG